MNVIKCNMCKIVVAKVVGGSTLRDGTECYCRECIEKCRAIVAGNSTEPNGISIFNDAAMKEAKRLDEEGG